MNQSTKYHLNQQDLDKILTGAFIALGGALLTYLAQIIPHTDFGSYSPIVTALAAILINAARKWLSGLPGNAAVTPATTTTQTVTPNQAENQVEKQPGNPTPPVQNAV